MHLNKEETKKSLLPASKIVFYLGLIYQEISCMTLLKNGEHALEHKETSALPMQAR